jgi:small-conductance mechanosensitive channel
MTQFFRELAYSVHPGRVLDYVKTNKIYIESSFFQGWDIFLIGLGIVAGGFLAGFILYKLILYFGLSSAQSPKFRVVKTDDGQMREAYDNDGKITWERLGAHSELHKKSSKSKKEAPLFYSARSSWVHFIALTVKYSVAIFAFYLAFSVAGLSVFSLAYSLGIIGLVGAYAFGTVLANTSGSFVMAGTGRFVEGMYLELAGIKGRLIEISGLFSTMSCKDDKTGKSFIAIIPNKFFNEVPVLRYPDKEPGLENVTFDHIETKIHFTPSHQLIKPAANIKSN